MGIYDVYGEGKQMEVREDTFGHLAPEFNRKYPGHILIATSPYYALGWTIVEEDFAGLDGGPWQYDALVDFVGDLADGLEEGALYLWRGTFEFFPPDEDGLQYLDRARYRFRGKARRVFIPGLPGTAMKRAGRKKRA